MTGRGGGLEGLPEGKSEGRSGSTPAAEDESTGNPQPYLGENCLSAKRPSEFTYRRGVYLHRL